MVARPNILVFLSDDHRLWSSWDLLQSRIGDADLGLSCEAHDRHGVPGQHRTVTELATPPEVHFAKHEDPASCPTLARPWHVDPAGG